MILYELLYYLFVDLILIFIGLVLILNIPPFRINIFGLSNDINKYTSYNFLHIALHLVYYFLLFCIICLLNDEIILVFINHTKFHFTKFMNASYKIALANSKFDNIVTESFLFIMILYILYFLSKTAYIIYRNKQLYRDIKLNKSMMNANLTNFFFKMIMYGLTTYSILLGVLHSIKDVSHISYDAVGVILIIPSIALVCLIAFTRSHEKEYLLRNVHDKLVMKELNN